ncbi:MAG: hypothetical protein ACLR0U_06255 [Enterocloster clostridioformis]
MQGLDKGDAVIVWRSFQFADSLMQFFQYAVQMSLVFPCTFLCTA